MSERHASFALLVEIRVHEGEVERFERAMRSSAEAAVRDEPDCHAFHVTRVEGDPTRFLLFELYTDAGALEAHRETPHFKRFHDEAGDTIAEKTSRRLDVV